MHGVPDPWRVWRALIGRLRRADVVTLSLPGFGCEVPAGFDCSKEAYCDWLLREVDNVEGPVDLVAHDWGAILALRVASLEPTLIRTWAVGGVQRLRGWAGANAQVVVVNWLTGSFTG